MASPPPPPPAVEKGVSPQLLRAIVERESIPIQNGEYGLPIKAEEAATKFNIDFKNLNELGQLAIYIPLNKKEIKVLFLICVKKR